MGHQSSLLQKLSDPHHRQSENSGRHLMIAFFDLLYLNHEDLMWHGFSRRREILEKVIRVIPNWAILAESRKFPVPQGPIGLEDVRVRGVFVPK